jgi:hypothetical protein
MSFGLANPKLIAQNPSNLLLSFSDFSIMHRKSSLFIFFIVGFFSLSSAQMMGFDEIDPGKVAPWKADQISDYQGVYHFGDSEMESNLVLLISGDIVSAQIRSGSFSVMNGQTVFIMEYRNLKEVKITGDQFYSAEYQGSFVVFEPNDEPLWGLKINNPWSGIPQPGQYEVGPREDEMTYFFYGNFPEASMRLLQSAEMAQYTKSDLQLMRNEIFARYGYIFRSGGKMEAHFKKQDWYSPTSKDVNGALTEIEKRNIQMIRKWENN